MRTFITMATLLAALTSVASAEPFEIDDGTPDPSRPTPHYVQGGVVAGFDGGLGAAGGTVEAGTQVSSIVWLHGSFLLGNANEIFASGNGSVVQARVGADLRNCNESGTLCGYVGVDIGVQHTQFHGMQERYGCNWDEADCSPTPYDESHDQAIGVGRLGLDVGGKHLRWRPGVEASVSPDGINGVNLTQSIAYRF